MSVRLFAHDIAPSMVGVRTALRVNTVPGNAKAAGQRRDGFIELSVR
jgi:hypothetical protein